MKILIAEDNRISRMTLVSFIRQMGYETLVAENGEEAIRLWEEEQPGIVLTDWNMPLASGVEVVRHIRSRESNQYTYTIMITSRDETDDLIEGFECGVDDYLTKPVNKQELMLRMKAGERLLNLQAKEILVFALAKLTEARDQETGAHLERMREYSRLLAQQLMKQGGYPETINRRFIDNLYETSPLHDVGKVGIPDAILLKEGRLTEREYEVMKEHTVIGYKTLHEVAAQSSNGRYLQMAADIACSHHEKWDGAGYPRGLVGEAIPLAARIVALADVYDALRSKRVYKPAFSHEETAQAIIKEAGKHFDPLVVEAFRQIQKDFMEISIAYQDEE